MYYKPVFHKSQGSVEEDRVDLVPRPEKPVYLCRLFKGLQEQLVISLNLKPGGMFALVLEILNVIECNKLQNIDFILMYIKNFFSYDAELWVNIWSTSHERPNL